MGRWGIGKRCLKVGGRIVMYLSASGCVLGSSTRDELRIAIVDQVVVETHVFLLSEDSIVGLHAVFLEHGGIAWTGISV